MSNEQFTHIVSLIHEARHRAFRAVNTELIELYWQIGKYLSERIAAAEWGSKTITQLASFLKAEHPDLKGFTRSNLFKMKQFYETYSGHKRVSTLSRQIPWSANTLIIGKSDSIEQMEFYIRLMIREKLSVRELERQIDTMTFERVALSKDQFPDMVAGERATNPFKDSYVFEFLDLPDRHTEKDLQQALLANLRRFILELGRGFTLVGENYRILVGRSTFYLDLLFFNRDLNCLIALELKVGDFKPEHIGQLNFYLEALDRDVKKDSENPSIGILLCSGKDDQVVEYATSRSLSPTKIAEYKTTLPQKDLLKQKLAEFQAYNQSNEGTLSGD